MMLAATIFVLVAWLAFIGIYDPDGMRRARRPAYRPVKACFRR